LLAKVIVGGGRAPKNTTFLVQRFPGPYENTGGGRINTSRQDRAKLSDIIVFGKSVRSALEAKARFTGSSRKEETIRKKILPASWAGQVKVIYLWHSFLK